MTFDPVIRGVLHLFAWQGCTAYTQQPAGQFCILFSYHGTIGCMRLLHLGATAIEYMYVTNDCLLIACTSIVQQYVFKK